MTFYEYFKSFDDLNISGMGTGFAVGDQYFLTAFHVVGKKNYIFTNGKILKAKKVFCSPFFDLCVLKTERHGLPSFKLDFSVTQVGTRVHTLSYSFKAKSEINPLISEGIITSSRNSVYQAEGLMTENGFSGAPVIDSNTGKVIGLITSTLPINQSKNLSTIITPVYTIEEELKGLRVNTDRVKIKSSVVVVLN